MWAFPAPLNWLDPSHASLNTDPTPHFLQNLLLPAVSTHPFLQILHFHSYRSHIPFPENPTFPYLQILTTFYRSYIPLPKILHFPSYRPYCFLQFLHTFLQILHSPSYRFLPLSTDPTLSFLQILHSASYSSYTLLPTDKIFRKSGGE